jgi:hypothetical protein
MRFCLNENFLNAKFLNKQLILTPFTFVYCADGSGFSFTKNTPLYFFIVGKA